MVKTLPALIASLRHYIALYQGNILPLPGTKRYVGRENPHSLFDSSLFTKSPETPINTGVPRGEEWRTTLHLSSPTLHLDIFSSDYAELTEHSCSTDYARIPSGVCLPLGVPADLQPSGVPADLQSAVKKCSTYETRGFPSGVYLPSGVPADLQSAVKKRSTYETGGFAIPPQSINS